MPDVKPVHDRKRRNWYDEVYSKRRKLAIAELDESSKDKLGVEACKVYLGAMSIEMSREERSDGVKVRAHLKRALEATSDHSFQVEEGSERPAKRVAKKGGK